MSCSVDRYVRPGGETLCVDQPRLPFGDLSLAQAQTSSEYALSVVGLFAGIGGVELGLHRAGHDTRLLCEYDDAAVAVLSERFPAVDLHRDVRELDELPEAELVAAGFPCQDLSIAGRAVGIE